MDKIKQKPGPKPKEKVEMPQVPAPEKVETPAGRPPVETPKKTAADTEKELDFYMARLHFPNGWKRDIKRIIKPLL
ncbi:MAG TPA: hypothetical protein VFX43_17740 [Chitinophagaceae bacterium]|nr:hypothetical protein [Chitinophagaceae bacterium]